MRSAESDAGSDVGSRRELIVRLTLVALVFALGLVAAVWIGRRQSTELEGRAQAILSEWRATLEAHPAERAVLYGTSVPGDAHAVYVSALDQAEKIPNFGDRASRALTTAALTEPDPDVDALLLEAAPVLETVRLGAHRERAALRLEAPTLEDVRALEHGQLGLLLQLFTRRSLAREPGAESARAALDALQWSSDQSLGPTLAELMVGTSTRDVVLTDLGRAAPWQAHSEAELRELLAGLTILERRASSLPHVHRSETLLMLESPPPGEPTEQFAPEIRAYMAHGGLDTLMGIVDAEQRLAESTKPLETLEELHREAKEGKTMNGRHMRLMVVRSVIRSMRARVIGQTRLRMLIEGLRFRLGDEADEFDDPTGHGFKRTRSADLFRISTKELTLEVDLR